MSGDIELRVHGDGSGGKEALDHVAEGAGHAHESVTGLQGAMHELGEELGHTMVSANLFSEAIEKGIEFVKEFAAESVKAYAAQELADRNLSLMAGNLTSSLKEQAEEFEKTYGVMATTTERVQTLALAHGADRDQVLELTEATTKWAAITGTDAAAAAENLTRAVETGRHSSKNLGIQWQETGDKAEDLKNAIEALNGKLAGADPTADATLEGRTNKAKLAMEGLQKSFGSWVANAEKNLGVLDKLASGLDAIRQKAGSKGVGGYLGMAAYGPMGALAGVGIGQLGADSDIADAPAPTHFADTEGDTAEVHGKFDKSAKQADAEYAKEEKKLEEHNARLSDEAAYHDAQENEREEKHGADLEEKMNEAWQKEEAEQQKALDEQLEHERVAHERELKEVKDSQAKQDDETWKALNAHDKKMLEEQQQFADQMEMQYFKMGERMGNALSQAILATTASLFKKQEVQWQDVVGGLLQVGLTIAGEVVGEYYGGAAGGMIGGQIGGTLGGIGSQALQSTKKQHEGSRWVERYHSGGWPGLGPDEVPLVGQVGENIWSKRDVARAGGPAAVESMKRGGGGGVQFHIYTQDAQGVRQFLAGRGGQAFFDTLRTGQGALPQLFARAGGRS